MGLCEGRPPAGKNSLGGTRYGFMPFEVDARSSDQYLSGMSKTLKPDALQARHSGIQSLGYLSSVFPEGMGEVESVAGYPETLTCTRCRQTKHQSLFPRRPSSKTGHGSWCKACVCAKVSEYQKTPEGKAAIRRRRLAGSQTIRVECGTTVSSPCPLYLGDTLVGYVDPEFAKAFSEALRNSEK